MVFSVIFPSSASFGLQPEKGLNNSGDYDQKDTAAEPRVRDLTGILIARIPLGIHFDRADQAENGTDGVHQAGAGFEITSDLRIGLVDPGVAILCFDYFVDYNNYCRNGKDS